jgi:hypothetical protein
MSPIEGGIDKRKRRSEVAAQQMSMARSGRPTTETKVARLLFRDLTKSGRMIRWIAANKGLATDQRADVLSHHCHVWSEKLYANADERRQSRPSCLAPAQQTQHEFKQLRNFTFDFLSQVRPGNIGTAAQKRIPGARTGMYCLGVFPFSLFCRICGDATW